MSRYPNADWKTRDMLLRIEADHPEFVGEYLNFIGANELPIPTTLPHNERKYRTWELWEDIDDGKSTKYWYATDVPADRTGYIDAMTRKHRFGSEEPPLPYEPVKSKKKASNDN